MTPTYKISIFNNYLSITSDDLPDFEGVIAVAKDVRIITSPEDNQIFEFWNLDGRGSKWNTLKLSQILDGNGDPFNIATWTVFYTSNTGQYGGTGGGTSGGATEATLSEINNKTPQLGQADSINSVPVVIASDQVLDAIVSGQIAVNSSVLPTGASTSALQTSQNNNLITIATNTGNTASNTAGTAASLSTIASNTSTIAVDADVSITGQSGQSAVGQNIILATAGTSGQSALSSRSIGIQIVPTGTVSSGVVTFEGSNDNVTFTPIFFYDNASPSSNPVSSFTPATGVARYFSGPLHFLFVRARISTIIGGGGGLQAYTVLRKAAYQPNFYAVTQSTAANLNITGIISSTSLTPGVTANNLGKAEDAVAASGDTGVFTLGVRRDTLISSSSATGDYNELAITQYGSQLVKSEEKHAKTYSASAQVSTATSATDIMLIPGNATSVVYITKIIISGTATVGRIQDIQLIRRTAPNTGGTSSSMSIAQHDSTDTAPSSTPITYTVNPTGLGASGGTVRRIHTALGTPASTDDNIAFIEFGDKGRPIILRGTAQGLAINLSGTATLSGDTFDVNVEWYEI